MPVLTLPPAAPAEQESLKPGPAWATAPRSNSFERYFARLFELTAQPAPWDRTSLLAIASIVALWAIRFCTTWATWGYLPVDVGRETYVPAMLAQGKMLYRDVWFGYAPLGPYINALLFRTFGIHIEVLYWAGSLSALGCALFLYLCGKKLGSALAGWAAAAIVLMQSFHAWHFSFPLAYSFSSVYGCLTGCAFLWAAMNACLTGRPLWMLGAGSLAAVAILLKLEYGAACYAAYALLTIGRALSNRSAKSLVGDSLAALPGLITCLAVGAWMISIGGFEFITQENLASTWPGSFFMTRYGRAWMESTGLQITGTAMLHAILRTSLIVGVIAEIYLVFYRKRFMVAEVVLIGVLSAGIIGYAAFGIDGDTLDRAAAILFPQDMVLYAGIAAVIVATRFIQGKRSPATMALGIVLAFGLLVAIRTLLRTMPTGYSIFYNGPAVLSFLILLRPAVARAERSRRAVLRLELLLCIGPLAVVSVYAARFAAVPGERLPLVTERGTVIASTQVTEQYRAAIALMKNEAAAGRMVLSVPEDTSLYFLSGTEAPARLYFFAPGMLVPGKMTTKIITEIDSKPVRYVLWSNRRFPEYGVPRFGIDSDQELGHYLTTHYHPVGPLIHASIVDFQVHFTLWEQNTPLPQKPAQN